MFIYTAVWLRIYVQQHTPQMQNSGDVTHPYLGWLPAARVLTTLTANPRARYHTEKTYTPNPTANFNANL